MSREIKMGQSGKSGARRGRLCAWAGAAALLTPLAMPAAGQVAPRPAPNPAARPAASGMTALVAEVVRTNPEIDAQRNQVRGLEARLSSARAAALPDVTANGQVQRRKIDVKNGGQGDSEFTSGQGTVEGRLQLFDGRRTANSIKLAEQELASGLAGYHGKVSDVLLDLLVAAADVHRDEAIRGYTDLQSDAIAAQLRAIGRRFEAGEATQTDQALARARLATAQTAIIAANESLGISRSAFVRVAGRAPGAVPDLPDLAPLPANLAAAQALAAANNPRVRAARRSAIAAKYGVAAAKGALLPHMDAVAGYEYLTGGVANLFTGKLPNDRSAAYGGVEVNVPLFRPRTYADIRRYDGLHAQRLSEFSAAQRNAADQATAAWTQWQSALATIEAARIAVAATEQAAEGVRREWNIGNRTLVEVLDAQNELLSARVALERAIHNEYVGRASVLAAVGELKPAAIRQAAYHAALQPRPTI